MARDYCKQAYDWEDGSFVADQHMVTWKAMQEAVSQACKYYGVEAPAVYRLKDEKLSYYDTKTKSIHLLPVHQNPFIILHETAHHIATVVLADNLPEDHGKPWLGIYQWLLIKFGLVKRKFLWASMVYGYRLPFCPLSPAMLKRKGQR